MLHCIDTVILENYMKTNKETLSFTLLNKFYTHANKIFFIHKYKFVFGESL